jgi:hypothetical protein
MQYQGKCTKSNDTWIECKFSIQQCVFGCCNPNGPCITLPNAELAATDSQQLKAEISADLGDAVGHICGGTYEQAIGHINDVLRKLSAI